MDHVTASKSVSDTTRNESLQQCTAAKSRQHNFSAREFGSFESVVVPQNA